MYSNFKGPEMFAVDITNNCNLKCLHCYNESGDKNNTELTEEEFLDVFKQISKLEPMNVCICGGEPLIKKELVFKALDILKDNVGNIGMVSNGTLITDEIAIKLKNRGLNNIQISLDGINSIEYENFRVKSNSFNQAVKGIESCIKAKIHTEVGFIPNKLNYLSFSHFCKKIYELGASGINSMPFIPMGRGDINKDWILSDNEYFIFQKSILDNQEQYNSTGFKIIWGDPIDHLSRMKNNSAIGYDTYQMNIKSNGDVDVSPYFSYVVGNIKKISIIDLWNTKYQKIWSDKSWLEYIKNIWTLSDLKDIV